jgi:hypothetical protein
VATIRKHFIVCAGDEVGRHWWEDMPEDMHSILARNVCSSGTVALDNPSDNPSHLQCYSLLPPLDYPVAPVNALGSEWVASAPFFSTTSDKKFKHPQNPSNASTPSTQTSDDRPNYSKYTPSGSSTLF